MISPKNCPIWTNSLGNGPVMRYYTTWRKSTEVAVSLYTLELRNLTTHGSKSPSDYISRYYWDLIQCKREQSFEAELPFADSLLIQLELLLSHFGQLIPTSLVIDMVKRGQRPWDQQDAVFVI